MNQKANKLVLRVGGAITSSGVLRNVSVSIADGIIQRISENAEAGLDLSDSMLYPGFIDIHIHGAAGKDLMSANGEDLVQVSSFLAGSGVTAWLPTLVPGRDAEYQSAADAIQDLIVKGPVGARALGIHYEGPFVNSQQCGALHPEHFQTFSDPQQIDLLPVPAGAQARMITVAPEIEGALELIRQLKQRNWIVSIGHTRADQKTLDRALTAGAAHMTHFMNAMAPLHHRAPGPIGWGFAHDDVTCDFIADGVHLDPFILKLLVKLKGSDRLMLISDAIAASGLGDGDYEIWGECIRVENGRTSNANGSIAGSVITMLDAVKLMLSLGVTEVEVARMASTNPARLLGLAGECGSIEEGKRADLVALDSDRNVRLTIVGGVICSEFKL